jgi:predicted DNA-binding protein (MmcQ/YjbR family)
VDLSFYREYCLNKPGVEECFPFDRDTLVFKVMGKMFALLDVDLFTSVNLKCDPERSIDLRERYEGIKPGFHMNKMHWNTIEVNTNIPDTMILALTDHSYELVVASLSKKLRYELSKL